MKQEYCTRFFAVTCIALFLCLFARSGEASYDQGDVAVINRLLENNDAGGVLASLGWQGDKPESWRPRKDKSGSGKPYVDIKWQKGRLNSLELWNTGLAGTLDIAGLAALKRLVVCNNDLPKVVGVDTLSAIEILMFYGNKCSDIGKLEGLTTLKRLDVRYNDLKDLGNLGRLTRLTDLKVGNNGLTGIDGLADLTALTELSVRSTSVTDLGDLSKLTRLTTLDISYNFRLEKVSGLGKLTRLKELKLWRSWFLEEIGDLSGLVNLRTLELAQSGLKDIGDLSGLERLEHLNLSSNYLKSIGSLARMPRLKYVDISGNDIVDIGRLTCGDVLETLKLSSNKLLRLPDLGGMKVLKHLEIASNPFENPEAVDSLRDGMVEVFEFSTGEYPVFVLADKPLSAVRELYVVLSGEAGKVDLGGRSLDEVYLSGEGGAYMEGKSLPVTPEALVVNAGPLKRLVLGSLAVSMSSLKELADTLKPGKFDVITTLSYHLDNALDGIEAGNAYPLAMVSPRLADDYRAAGEGAMLFVGGKEMKRGGVAARDVGMAYDGLVAGYGRAASPTSSVKDGTITFGEPGEYYLVLYSKNLDGAGAKAIVNYMNAFTVTK